MEKGKQTEPETARIVNLVMENLEKEAKEREEGKTLNSERGVNALTRALGKKDHRGYVKGLGRFGVGVGYEKAFGKANRKGKISINNGCSNEEIGSVKAKLTQDLEQKFEVRLQESVAVAVQAYIAPLPPSNNMPSNALQIQGSKQQEPHKDVTTKCRLAVIDEFNEGNLVVVAEGTVHPIPTTVMHNSQTDLPGHYRVSVDKVYEDHDMIDLPVPSPDGITKLRNLENYFVVFSSISRL